MEKKAAFALEVVATGVLALAGSLVCYRLWQHNPAIAGENQLMEGLQAVLLGLALLLCLGKLVSGKFSQTDIPLGFLALFFLTFFLREVDIERYNLPHWIILLASGRGRNTLLGASWLGYAVFCLRRRGTWWPEFLRFLTCRPGIYFLVASVLYLVGYPFDKELFPLSKPQRRFFEELFELVATFFFALSAWRAVKIAKKSA